MTALPKPNLPAGILDDPEALAALMDRSFEQAAREAIAENDRLGVPSHGGEHGKVVTRRPARDAAGGGRG